MKSTKLNVCHAFIDGANLHKGVFDVTNAYIFLGLIPAHKDLYADLQEMGYILKLKETVMPN